jgi:putative two-component system hydrogenase maturation factor HypX/HoxX
MRILLLTHAFNSLTQRLWVDLGAAGHQLSVEFDIADSVSEEAVALFKPDLIIAPYLRRAIPQSIWSRHVCLIVHPGPPGDRGPSALDWAILHNADDWGVTVLQAEAEMDGGPVWASAAFPLRHARKGSLYRNEVTEAAARAVMEAVQRFAATDFSPQRVTHSQWQPLARQPDRAIDWQRDDSVTVLRKINAADGFPGVADSLFGSPCHLFDAHLEGAIKGAPGEIIARRETALLRGTRDGAVWIGHVKRTDSIKLPATLAYAAESAALPHSGHSIPPVPQGSPSVTSTPETWWRSDTPTWQDIAYEEADSVGFLYFEFYNGAMSTRQCERLREALAWAKARPISVLVLMGGEDFWSNGIHLNVIEHASLAGGSPADESWRNINAMNDLTRELIDSPGQITVAALGGNTGAGGCFLARAADWVWIREGVILNPHYKNMGNLYGSEYWTYLLPRRVGEEGARKIMTDRLPLGSARSVTLGLADALLPGGRHAFRTEVARRAAEIAVAPNLALQLDEKSKRRVADEATKPLEKYREEELKQMQRNFYGFDPSYHVARFHFVSKSLASWTPRHLARHRDIGWKVPT